MITARHPLIEANIAFRINGVRTAWVLVIGDSIEHKSSNRRSANLPENMK